MGRWVAERMVREAHASAPGRLLAVPAGDGWYPILLRPDRGQHVRGTLVDLVLTRGELALLDRYEGREYRRLALPVRCENGVRLAQAWAWLVPVPRGAQPVPEGDFLAWLERTRRNAFTTLRNGA